MTLNSMQFFFFGRNKQPSQNSMVILLYPLLVELQPKIIPRSVKLGEKAERGGGAGVERISIYTLRSEEQPSLGLAA